MQILSHFVYWLSFPLILICIRGFSRVFWDFWLCIVLYMFVDSKSKKICLDVSFLCLDISHMLLIFGGVCVCFFVFCF